MICPDCGNTEASIGEAVMSDNNEAVIKIECPNSYCTNYKGCDVEDVEEDDEDEYDDYYNENYYDDEPVRANPFARPHNFRDVSHIEVRIVTKKRRRNTIEIQFALAGDVGVADKCVEFFWYKEESPENKKLASLSNNCKTFLRGLNADGRTLYKTHWKCKDDGIDPSEEGIELTANVF